MSRFDLKRLLRGYVGWWLFWIAVWVGAFLFIPVVLVLLVRWGAFVSRYI